jgi:dipeptidyl aminopeptidase/acylaminoacyl peptidase
MISVKNTGIRKSDSDLIQSSLYINSINTSVKTPILIFAHGFKGFKDWGGFPYLCNKLAEAGFAVLSFNFSHNGVSDDSPMDFTKLDMFAQNTHSIELLDLNSVIDSIPGLAEEHNFDPGKIGLIGHSRGGGASIISAAEDRRIKALVTLASIAEFDRYTLEQKKRWREKGYIEIPNTRTNQMMRMNIDILSAASRLNKPYMIIHGKEDLAVKYTDAEKIYSSSDKDLTELHIIESTGHTFGVEHPFKGTTKAFDEVIELTNVFFKKNLA